MLWNHREVPAALRQSPAALRRRLQPRPDPLSDPGQVGPLPELLHTGQYCRGTHRAVTVLQGYTSGCDSTEGVNFGL